MRTGIVRTVIRLATLAACLPAAGVLAGGSACFAQAPSAVIGLASGDTIGFSWTLVDPGHERNAYEATAGWTVRGADAWEFRWMYRRTAFVVSGLGGELDLYAGIGLRVKLEEDTVYGARGALGICRVSTHRRTHPEIFLEAAPTRDVSPRYRTSVGFAAGVRWRI